MGYSSKYYALETCEPYGRDDSICDVGAKRAIYRVERGQSQPLVSFYLESGSVPHFESSSA